MNRKLDYVLKRARLEIGEGISNGFDKVKSGRHMYSVKEDTDEFGEGIKDKIIGSSAGAAVSGALTDLYAAVKNKGIIREDDVICIDDQFDGDGIDGSEEQTNE